MKELPHITLRAIEPEDLDLLYHIENDRQLWDVGATSVPYSRYALHDYVANASADIYADKQVRLIIEDEAHKVVGLADLTDFDPKHLRAEVGIVIVKNERGRHLAKSTLEALHEYALRTLHLHQIYAIISTANKTAVTLFRDLGYADDALLKDWIYDGQTYHDARLFQKILV
ncbi:MAG: GNAT family N-acetyltransferase [Prevotella sp.]|nr:GNAT family N-acetyltransferase [Prevotella sp.]